MSILLKNDGSNIEIIDSFLTIREKNNVFLYNITNQLHMYGAVQMYLS